LMLAAVTLVAHILVACAMHVGAYRWIARATGLRS
jgi:hypothetical protein